MNLPAYARATDRVVLEKLLNITLSLSGERHIPTLYEHIIHAAQDLTHADGGTLYIVTEEGGKPTGLKFEVIRNISLSLHQGGTSTHSINYPAIPLTLPDGSMNESNVCAYAYHHGRMINIPDAYQSGTYDFSGTRTFDKQFGYRSKSMLTVPLSNHAGDVIGVLQLINAQHPVTGTTIQFDSSLEPIVAALASSAAITLDNQLLLQGHRDLLDAFIRAIAQAIDAKSAHTSGHCQRVPVLTELMAEAACEEQTGPLKDFALDHNDWYELRVAAWLHDCGKLATPDSLLDKATKLHALSDRIETIQARFAALIAQTEARWLREQSAKSDPASHEALRVAIEALREDCAFLERANLGGEFMRPEDQARVRSMADYVWHDHTGEPQPLLTSNEVEMLCIERGTLSADERQHINHHIDVTIQMLEALPFPKHLKRVPEYAGGHHEKIDGTGFPRGLTGEQMSWPARMMAIADIFEALTARDRPYKAPMPLSQALSILRGMRDRSHIDPDLYHLFLTHRVWDTYAQQFLLPEQLDVQDSTPYL